MIYVYWLFILVLVQINIKGCSLFGSMHEEPADKTKSFMKIIWRSFKHTKCPVLKYH